MRSINSQLPDLLAEHYGMTVAGVRSLWTGTTAVHAHIFTTTADYFVKTYPLRADFAYEQLNIATAHAWSTAGIPGGVPLASAAGNLIHRQPGVALSVWRWLPGRSAIPFTEQTARQAGSALARLHRFLDHLDLPKLPINPEHAHAAPAETITRRFTRLLQLTAASGTYRATQTARVRRRLDQLHALNRLRGGLPQYRIGSVHGDLTSSNVMISGRQLAAFLDPRIQLAQRARELGRLAFDPHTVAIANAWPRIGVSCIAGYLDAAGPLSIEDITAAARHAVLHSMTSTYPLEDLLTTQPKPKLRDQQLRYWNHRCITVDRLLPALPVIEAHLHRLARQHAHAAAGRR